MLSEKEVDDCMDRFLRWEGDMSSVDAVPGVVAGLLTINPRYPAGRRYKLTPRGQAFMERREFEARKAEKDGRGS